MIRSLGRCMRRASRGRVAGRAGLHRVTGAFARLATARVAATGGALHRSVYRAAAIPAENRQRIDAYNAFGMPDDPAATRYGVRKRLRCRGGMRRASYRIRLGLNACVGGEPASHGRGMRGARSVAAPAVQVGARRLEFCSAQLFFVLTAFSTDLAHKQFQRGMRNPASGWQQTSGCPSASDVPDRDSVPKQIGYLIAVPKASRRVTRRDERCSEVPVRGREAET